MGNSFIQLNHKNPDTIELLKHPNEWALLSLVAVRARRTINKIDDILIRQAKIGDYKSCGLTRQQYRTALKNLVKWDFLTINSTNKGTIATLCNDDVFNINVEEPNHQINQNLTIKQPPDNHQATSNNNINKDNNNNNKHFSSKNKEIDIFCKKVISSFNRILGKNFSPTESNIKPIKARLAERAKLKELPRYTLEDFEKVILIKKKDPYFIANPRFYNPSTLFGGKFENYLNEEQKKPFNEL